MLNMAIADLSQQLGHTIEAYQLSLRAAKDEMSRQQLTMIDALQKNIQVMQRLQSDREHGRSLLLKPEEVTEIGDYALQLLDQLAIACAARGLQHEMLSLQRLSMPIVSWLAEHGGQLEKLDIVVNAIASYANTLQQTQQLEVLCSFTKTVVDITAKTIRQDLEAVDPMRPWRVLNLNWGIVATRSHNTELMESVFLQLIENIPADSTQFFREGMQQMEIVNYPDHVRQVMQKFAERTAAQGAVH